MIDFHALLNAIVYALLGIVIFGGAFVLVDKMTPENLWREITTEKNMALAILVGLMSLGVCIIIAAAIH